MNANDEQALAGIDALNKARTAYITSLEPADDVLEKAIVHAMAVGFESGFRAGLAVRIEVRKGSQDLPGTPGLSGAGPAAGA